ncbi:HET-domain-containing protein [Melanomma pulvis-pyrius CBS 109.77]|uniref:HET-domain-containing protein n=1 Tax=Melanomma pulvis-pyrius CBS 109.77 TaxID=1314802 RepID=A0A6A6XSI0_9PLEO|nr:HET-domain-containing protein [Melanomma pulvis-pyrius CBS 109.77]
MRLLNTTTLEFRDFFDDKPQYAILSHRWLSADEGGEATYRDFVDLRQRPEAQWTASIRKVKTFCTIARSQGINWAWSDTCCINKDSESELAESINSMWQWYAKSAFCIVYLPDVPSAPSMEARQEAAMKSVWFTRGWTLQELLAPHHMTFFDRAWEPIGTRDELADRICRRTNIERRYFGNLYQIKQASAATRLSWAAGRTLTRPEDVAYCLVGIMGIYVSPRYGSGREEAFRALQMEFTKKYRDQSIFAWEIPTASPDDHYGLFAPSPDAFAKTGNFNPSKHSVWAHLDWQVTDQGLLAGTYMANHIIPWIGTIQTMMNEIAISVDAVDENGRVPRLQLRKSNGVFYRVNAHELSLNGRKDIIGRSKIWGIYTFCLLIPFSWQKKLNIIL